jgi:UDP-glucose 4-epimerase
MRVLVTGGAGYVGVSLVEQLSKHSDIDEIIVYDNLSARSHGLFLHAKLGSVPIRFIQAELLDTRQLERAATGVDLVYHLAAVVKTPFANFDPHYFEQTNHWGCAELARILERSKPKRLIFTSSAAVYGSSDSLFSENSEPTPKTYYAVSKLRGEEQLGRLRDRFEVFNIRLGNIYGVNPCMRFDAVINSFILQAKFQKKIQIHGDGSQRRTFININQVGESLARLKDLKIESGTFNLSAHNLSIIEVADKLQELIPDLEFIYMDQHIQFPNLQLELEGKLSEALDMQSTDFHQDLKASIGSLSF